MSHPPPLTFIECESVGAWEQLAKPRSAYDVIVDALFGTGSDTSSRRRVY
jgi:NAD(P)H-hydrate repair Nnr-like enzyme with NAD(P)H-hydrate epimerase domain